MSLLRKKLSDARDFAIQKTFHFWQKFGFHIISSNYNSPIPNTNSLIEDIWINPPKLRGIDMNPKKQLKLLSIFDSNFKEEYNKFPKNKTTKENEFYLKNPYFGSIDSEILYCFIRHFKPKKILEIGSGFSTLISAQAILQNKQDYEKYDCKLVSIEPYPKQFLLADIPGLSEIIEKKVQDIPLSTFQKLKENDILFIDSSHVLKIGSDVYYEYLDIIPNLRKGVIIQIHDIFFPEEYNKNWILKDHRFWNEQYLLQSFLTFNDSFEVLWAGRYMLCKNANILKKAFKNFDKQISWPCSFWMKKIK